MDHSAMSDNSSESSLMKGDTAADLNSKYNRLATEYSKLRAQNTVLKKAVIDEQAKNNDLNETIRSKNQIIRKADQEMEALKFRNSQLTVRITVLQEELDSLNNKSSKKKSKHAGNSNGIVGNNLLDIEIENTMMEHAKLISELSRKDEMHEEKVKALRNEISNLNYELEQKNIKMKQILDKHKMVVEQLQKEQQDMKRDYASKVVKLKETEVELSTLKNVHKTYVDETGPKLDALTEILPRKYPFLDEEYDFLNRLNVHFSKPVYNEESHVKQLQKQFITLLLTFYNIIHNVTLELKELGLEELKMYIKTLLKDDDGVQMNEKLNACYHLLNNAELESSAPNSMQIIVHGFMKSFLDFAVAVQALYSSTRPTYHDSSVSSQTVEESIRVALEEFNIKKNELATKVITLPDSLHSLIHDEFENLNEAIQKLVTVVDLIYKKRLEATSNKLENSIEFKKKTILYLRSLKKEPAERIPYEEALMNRIKLQEYEILNYNLKQEIKALEDTITILEQESVKILNDYQVERSVATPDEVGVSNFIKNSHNVVNELGKLVSPYEVPAEIVAREKKMERYMNVKLSKLVVEKQEALSKARTYILECKALQRRLEYCTAEKQLLEQKYLKSHETSNELKEELNTVSQNYESHLSVMSEHLAIVNEKLATQSEEIDKLHYQLNNKASKRNKVK